MKEENSLVFEVDAMAANATLFCSTRGNGGHLDFSREIKFIAKWPCVSC